MLRFYYLYRKCSPCTISKPNYRLTDVIMETYCSCVRTLQFLDISIYDNYRQCYFAVALDNVVSLYNYKF